MADGRHIAKCWKRYNSPTNRPIWMKLVVASRHVPDMSPIMRLPRQRQLPSNNAFSSYGRLEPEHVNQF